MGTLYFFFLVVILVFSCGGLGCILLYVHIPPLVQRNIMIQKCRKGGDTLLNSQEGVTVYSVLLIIGNF